MALERVEVAGDPPVRGVLHRASGAAGLVLTHGAAGNMDSPLLIAVAEAFATRGVSVLRCNLPYRQARAGGPPSPATAARDREGLRAALDVLRSRISGRAFLGGHSYGGRMASMLAASDASDASALLLQSYPLHPPGKPAHKRDAHFPNIHIPTLFIHGTTDPFTTPDELASARALIPARTEVLSLQAGHDLGWGRKPRDPNLPARIADTFMKLADAGEEPGR